jgi:hypothetical protein
MARGGLREPTPPSYLMADVACPSNEDASLFTTGLFLALNSVIPEAIGVIPSGP